MKHPILYRLVFYSVLLSMGAAIIYLTSLMNYAPFKSSDMRDAFYDGCNFGGPRPLTDEHVVMCRGVADMYKETLDDLDKQMEEALDGNNQ
jgi:hypothetical protein